MALDEDLQDVPWGSASVSTHNQALSPLAALAETQTLTGLSSAAFSEMAQWRSATAHEQQAQQAQQQQAKEELLRREQREQAHQLFSYVGASGPTSPLRATGSIFAQSLNFDLPFTIDVDDAVEQRPLTALSSETLPRSGSATCGAGATPRTASRKRRHEHTVTDSTAEPFALDAGAFVVPTPTKPSPDGEKKYTARPGGGSGNATPRSISFSSLTRRISVTTASNGCPGSSLGASAPSPSGRAESPFGKGRRSTSPFITIKPPPASLDALRSINIMVNRANPSSRGRASSKGRSSSSLSGGRSAATSPAPSARATTPRPPRQRRRRSARALQARPPRLLPLRRHSHPNLQRSSQPSSRRPKPCSSCLLPSSHRMLRRQQGGVPGATSWFKRSAASAVLYDPAARLASDGSLDYVTGDHRVRWTCCRGQQTQDHGYSPTAPTLLQRCWLDQLHVPRVAEMMC